jgi:hypothetical protein
MLSAYNPRNSFISRTRQITRKCSFCNESGHNIRNCHSQSLLEAREQLFNTKADFITINQDDIVKTIHDMEQFIGMSCSTQEGEKLFKAVSVRFCEGIMTNTVEETVSILMNDLFGNETLNTIMYANIILNLLNQQNSEDFIPFTNEMGANEMGANETIGIRKNRFTIIEKDISKSSSIDCSICFECVKPEEQVTLNCKHTFCVGCIVQWTNQKSSCPTCRTEIISLELYPKKNV